MEINWRKVVIGALVIIVILYVVWEPRSAAGLVKDIFSWLQDAGESFIEFIKNLRF